MAGLNAKALEKEYMQLLFSFLGFKWHNTLFGALLLALASLGWIGFLFAGSFNPTRISSILPVLTFVLALIQIIRILMKR